MRWIAAVGSSVATYLPIIAGLLQPMIWPLLYASPFLYHLLYWWWSPFEQYFGPQWFFLTSYVTGTQSTNQLAPVPIAVGPVLLAWGLGAIVKARIRRQGLITTGLYRYVRHPQHLGIAVLTFGLFMLNPLGIRLGDVVAWTLVVFAYVLLADSEERALQREFGEAYRRYQQLVPFMAPFIPTAYVGSARLLPACGWPRRLALMGMYALVLAATVWLLMLLPSYRTR
jgi:protein-S-isoprenylcysteine O-methyltransferase Ste14